MQYSHQVCRCSENSVSHYTSPPHRADLEYTEYTGVRSMTTVSIVDPVIMLIFIAVFVHVD